MKIRQKLLLAMALLVFVASTTFSVLAYKAEERALLDGIDGELLAAARFAKAMLPKDYHDRIRGKDSVAEEDYLVIVDTWNGLCRDLGLQYIWSLMVIDDEIVFTTGTSTSKDVTKGDHASFFDVHTNPGAYENAFATMEVERSTFHDKWGAGRMVVVPAYDARGRKYLFGASRTLEEVEERLRATLWKSGQTGLVVFAIALGLSLILASSISRPIVRLTEVAKGIARGDLSQTIKPKGSAEVADLSRSIATMSRAIRDTISELAESEERARTLFEGIDDALFVHDTEGRILDCNEAACRRLGYTRDELLAMRTSDVDGPEFAKGFEERLKDQLSEGRFSCEGVHLTKEGVRIPVDINTSTIEYRGKRAILSVMRDISDRKKAEEERRHLEAQVQHAQKLESLGVLAGGIAHDFNNLLMGVLGYADIALEDLPAESPVRGSIEEIEKAAQRAAGLARQMLAYSGKGRFAVTAVNLSASVEEMTRLLDVSVSKKAVVKYDLAEDLPAVEADRTQIQQVVMNLVINASDAIGDESGVINVATGVMDCDREYLRETFLDNDLAEGRYVYLEVSDTGCGMAPEERGKIFDPFYTTKFTGRGLGLAAVLGIVRGHRGAIKVYSEEGKGSTIKVLFPASDQGAELDIERGAEEVEWKGHGTVLLVDDEEMVRVLAQEMLERLGFEVLTASDGREGVEVYERGHEEIALVLLDMTMPRMGGAEAFQEMRRIHKDVRVILCSGYNEKETTSRFCGKGLAGFLQKPYTSKALAAKVRQVLPA